MADAIEYAHANGVVHRDVKPSNVMFDAAGKVYVMDFGLAKRDAGEITMTQDGQILGTPAYMSPEQARGEGHKVDRRSDVYSLGVMLYLLLTNELPFRGNVRMLLHQVLHDEPRPPRALNDRIPRDLETITLKAMAKEPVRRYETAKALADDLRRWLDGETIRARPAGALEKGWRWCRRRPVIAGLSAALVAAIVGGLIGTTVGLWRALRAQAKEREQAEVASAQAELASEQAELARSRLYDARMILAQHAWEDWSPSAFQQALDEQLPENQGGVDRRGFEWFYWRRKSESGHSTLRGHTSIVTCVAFSPDGCRLASAGADRAVRVWDAATGQEVLTLRGHDDFVAGVAFSPDGRRLASVSQDNTGKVWDASPVTPESRAREEALDLVRFLMDRVDSEAELRARIADDRTISSATRTAALEYTGPFWAGAVRQRVESLVSGLFARLLLREDVIQALEADGTLDPEVRASAVAHARFQPVPAVNINDAAWNLVVSPGRPEADARRALRLAERACQVEGENGQYYGSYLNTLGVAQYRAGRYAEAVGTLERSNRLNGEQQPADLAFLAMGQHQLGRRDAARGWLDRLRALMRSVPEAAKGENQGFLREAEALIDPDAGFPANPFAR